jgi:DNA modification methylase
MAVNDMQLTMPFVPENIIRINFDAPYRDRLEALLSGDLSFHGQDSAYASHNFHSFPAKFPPQLPRNFITGLTKPGDTILDPMAGSGTTVLEAYLTDRRCIGFDIDPLALLLTQVKVTPFSPYQIRKMGHEIVLNARRALREQTAFLMQSLNQQWDEGTKDFVDYWFAPETQLELMALKIEVEKITDLSIRSFFRLIFSSIIITKSGGVSLARDLAHTRPHRAKLVYTPSGEILMGHDLVELKSDRLEYVTKILRSPVVEFEKRVQKNVASVHELPQGRFLPQIQVGNAQALPLPANSIDLIVTSPPYASNAIDYMRAHKFSLVWFDYPIQELGQQRGKYIGGESITHITFEPLPDNTRSLVESISNLDTRKGQVLHRYYSEMTHVLREKFRVLKPGKAAIVVVGSSVMRGKDTETAVCLADIGRQIGFQVPPIGIRELDRDKRMMPAGNTVNKKSQIQQRMHEEYVIGFLKPE